jgi:hypothetical protein
MGTNTYWIGFLTDNADVDLVMSHLVAVCQCICYPARISADSDLVRPESSPVFGDSTTSRQSLALEPSGFNHSSQASRQSLSKLFQRLHISIPSTAGSSEIVLRGRLTEE